MAELFIEGQAFNVSPDKLQAFMAKYPNAKRLDANRFVDGTVYSVSDPSRIAAFNQLHPKALRLPPAQAASEPAVPVAQPVVADPVTETSTMPEAASLALPIPSQAAPAPMPVAPATAAPQAVKPTIALATREPAAVAPEDDEYVDRGVLGKLADSKVWRATKSISGKIVGDLAQKMDAFQRVPATTDMAVRTVPEMAVGALLETRLGREAATGIANQFRVKPRTAEQDEADYQRRYQEFSLGMENKRAQKDGTFFKSTPQWVQDAYKVKADSGGMKTILAEFVKNSPNMALGMSRPMAPLAIYSMFAQEAMSFQDQARANYPQLSFREIDEAATAYAVVASIIEYGQNVGLTKAFGPMGGDRIVKLLKKNPWLNNTLGRFLDVSNNALEEGGQQFWQNIIEMAAVDKHNAEHPESYIPPRYGKDGKPIAPVKTAFEGVGQSMGIGAGVSAIPNLIGLGRHGTGTLIRRAERKAQHTREGQALAAKELLPMSYRPNVPESRDKLIKKAWSRFSQRSEKPPDAKFLADANEMIDKGADNDEILSRAVQLKRSTSEHPQAADRFVAAYNDARAGVGMVPDGEGGMKSAWKDERAGEATDQWMELQANEQKKATQVAKFEGRLGTTEDIVDEVSKDIPNVTAEERAFFIQRAGKGSSTETTKSAEDIALDYKAFSDSKPAVRSPAAFIKWESAQQTAGTLPSANRAKEISDFTAMHGVASAEIKADPNVAPMGDSVNNLIASVQAREGGAGPKSSALKASWNTFSQGPAAKSISERDYITEKERGIAEHNAFRTWLAEQKTAEAKTAQESIQEEEAATGEWNDFNKTSSRVADTDAAAKNAATIAHNRVLDISVLNATDEARNGLITQEDVEAIADAESKVVDGKGAPKNAGAPKRRADAVKERVAYRAAVNAKTTTDTFEQWKADQKRMYGKVPSVKPPPASVAPAPVSEKREWSEVPDSPLELGIVKPNESTPSATTPKTTQPKVGADAQAGQEPAAGAPPVKVKTKKEIAFEAMVAKKKAEADAKKATAPAPVVEQPAPVKKAKPAATKNRFEKGAPVVERGRKTRLVIVSDQNADGDVMVHNSVTDLKYTMNVANLKPAPLRPGEKRMQPVDGETDEQLQAREEEALQAAGVDEYEAPPLKSPTLKLAKPTQTAPTDTTTVNVDRSVQDENEAADRQRSEEIAHNEKIAKLKAARVTAEENAPVVAPAAPKVSEKQTDEQLKATIDKSMSKSNFHFVNTGTRKSPAGGNVLRAATSSDGRIGILFVRGTAHQKTSRGAIIARGSTEMANVERVPAKEPLWRRILGATGQSEMFIVTLDEDNADQTTVDHELAEIISWMASNRDGHHANHFFTDANRELQKVDSTIDLKTVRGGHRFALQMETQEGRDRLADAMLDAPPTARDGLRGWLKGVLSGLKLFKGDGYIATEWQWITDTDKQSFAKGLRDFSALRFMSNADVLTETRVQIHGDPDEEKRFSGDTRFSLAASVQEKMSPQDNTKLVQDFTKAMTDARAMTVRFRAWAKSRTAGFKQANISAMQDFFEAHPADYAVIKAHAKTLNSNIFNADGKLIPTEIEALMTSEGNLVMYSAIKDNPFLAQNYLMDAKYANMRSKIMADVGTDRAKIKARNAAISKLQAQADAYGVKLDIANPQATIDQIKPLRDARIRTAITEMAREAGVVIPSSVSAIQKFDDYYEKASALFHVEQKEFPSFLRSINQFLVDRMPADTREQVRKSFYNTIRESFKAGTLAENDFTLTSDAPAKPSAKNVKDAVNKIFLMSDLAASPLRGASKTMAAMNQNVACPMFVIGNSACWMNACYLTAMGKSAGGLAYYEHAMYTGEILQLPDWVVEKLNKTGGLRLNGVGDFTQAQALQMRDIVKDAKDRGLNLKIITKQAGVADLLQDMNDGVGGESIDVSHVVVQPSMDFLWVPVKNDLMVKGNGLMDTVFKGMTLTEALESLDNADRDTAVAAAIEEFYGRKAERSAKDGILRRKYGFSLEQVNEMRAKNPSVNVLPRWVVTTPQEIADAALIDAPMIYTAMHGKVDGDMYSERSGGGFVNFGDNRHRFISGVLAGSAHNSSSVANVYRVVNEYISANYTPEQQATIYKNLERGLCCQENDSEHACGDCAAHCAMRRMADAMQQEAMLSAAKQHAEAKQLGVDGGTRRDVQTAEELAKSEKAALPAAKVVKSKKRLQPASPEQDAAYMSAVNEGRTAEAQRMVDEAAMNNGYNIGYVYHGTRAKFDTFDNDNHQPDVGEERIGGREFFFTASEKSAREFAGPNGRVIKAYLRAENLKDSTSGLNLATAGVEGGNTSGRTMQMVDHDPRTGVTGARRDFAVLDPRQIKYADVVTRVNGEIVPLSQRFNTDSADMRFQPVSENADDVWSYPAEQKISSKATAINEKKIPSLYSRVLAMNGWKRGTINVDIGGGWYDHVTDWLGKIGVTSHVFDPFNRTREHNDATVDAVANGKADTATVSNVLNVVAEASARDRIIRQAANAIKQDGVAYFTAGYKVDSTGAGRVTKQGWQNNQGQKMYEDEIKKHFGNVTVRDGVIIARDPIKSTPPDGGKRFQPVDDAKYDKAMRGNPMIPPPGPKTDLDAWAKKHPREALIMRNQVRVAALEAGYDASKPVQHGSTHKFTVFDITKASPEGDWGAGFYFSNTPADVTKNYAGIGPDLTNKIEARVDRLLSDDAFEEEFSAKQASGDIAPNMNLQSYARSVAQSQLVGTSPNAIEAYVNLANPVVIGGDSPTRFTFEEAEEASGDLYQEPTGTLIDFAHWLKVAAADHSADADNAVTAMFDKAMGNGGITAEEATRIAKSDDELNSASTDDGDIVSSEIVRQALELSGYDGVIDYTVNRKFGSEKVRVGLDGVTRKIPNAMPGMTPDTYHVVAFRPSQIKSSAIATFDDKGKVIPPSQRFDASKHDIRFQPIGDGAEVDSEHDGIAFSELSPDAQARTIESWRRSIADTSPERRQQILSTGAMGNRFRRAGQRAQNYDGRALPAADMFRLYAGQAAQNLVHAPVVRAYQNWEDDYHRIMSNVHESLRKVKDLGPRELEQMQSWVMWRQKFGNETMEARIKRMYEGRDQVEMLAKYSTANPTAEQKQAIREIQTILATDLFPIISRSYKAVTGEELKMDMNQGDAGWFPYVFSENGIDDVANFPNEFDQKLKTILRGETPSAAVGAGDQGRVTAPGSTAVHGRVGGATDMPLDNLNEAVDRFVKQSLYDAHINPEVHKWNKLRGEAVAGVRPIDRAIGSENRKMIDDYMDVVAHNGGFRGAGKDIKVWNAMLRNFAGSQIASSVSAVLFQLEPLIIAHGVIRSGMVNSATKDVLTNSIARQWMHEASAEVRHRVTGVADIQAQQHDYLTGGKKVLEMSKEAAMWPLLSLDKKAFEITWLAAAKQWGKDNGVEINYNGDADPRMVKYADSMAVAINSSPKIVHKPVAMSTGLTGVKGLDQNRWLTKATTMFLTPSFFQQALIRDRLVHGDDKMKFLAAWAMAVIYGVIVGEIRRRVYRQEKWWNKDAQLKGSKQLAIARKLTGNENAAVDAVYYVDQFKSQALSYSPLTMPISLLMGGGRAGIPIGNALRQAKDAATGLFRAITDGKDKIEVSERIGVFASLAAQIGKGVPYAGTVSRELRKLIKDQTKAKKEAAKPVKGLEMDGLDMDGMDAESLLE